MEDGAVGEFFDSFNNFDEHQSSSSMGIESSESGSGVVVQTWSNGENGSSSSGSKWSRTFPIVFPIRIMSIFL